MKEFLLGLAVAVALYLLWKKEHATTAATAATVAQTPAIPSPVTGCGCSKGMAAAPISVIGQISPGAPPLGASLSFYNEQGPIPDTSFGFVPGSSTPGSVVPAATDIPTRSNLILVGTYKGRYVQ
jgi:hypothetical protein